MHNPFFNEKELRLRAFFRIILFLFLFGFLVIIPALIPISWIEYSVRSVLIFGLYFLMIKFVDLRLWNESGLVMSSKWLKECVAGILIAGLAMSFIFISEWLSGDLIITGYGWQRKSEIFWLLPVLSFLIQMLSVGFYEELMARGYLLKNIAEGFSFGKIKPKQSAVIAVIISSAIFGFGHAGNPNVTGFAVLNILFAGIMLAIPFIITGRLALSIGLHFAWNFFQGGVFGFRVSGLTVRNSIFQIQQTGPDWLTGGSFGPEGGLIGVLGILLALILTLLYLKKTDTGLYISSEFSDRYTKKRRDFVSADELA